MIYSLLQKALFCLDAENAHNLGLYGVGFFGDTGLSRFLAAPAPSCPVEVMGLKFPNPVGLAAGMDKNGEFIDGLAALGFGHIEIGTVTPRPQPGNIRPRLFRLIKKQAIINRMGFNNEGVDQLLANVAQANFAKQGGILGINIGKNADTPIHSAADDYLICLDKVYLPASYVTINISSPNTKNLRDLQQDSALDDLLGKLKLAQDRLADTHGKYTPLALKIAPDIDDGQIAAIADIVRHHRFDALIATNTTLSRHGVEGLPNSTEDGGLSGAPLFASSTEVLRKLAQKLAGEVPLIGVGGILNGSHARDKMAAGASLVQFYTGFIYRGPELIGECVRACLAADDKRDHPKSESL